MNYTSRQPGWRPLDARRALGDHVFESLIQNKTIEWDAYRRHVSDFEMDRYLAVL